MNKYTLGRDILVSWALDLGGQSVNLADCDLQFDYSAAGGTCVVPASDYTIENNVLTWTFKKENQHAYGVYGLHLVASSDGVGVAEFNDKAAFELIHGEVSDAPQTLDAQSTVETEQEQPAPEPEPVADDVEHYVSRAPLHVEKVPLGSNIIVNWKLLSSDEFDFPLDECELHLFYAAAGSGCQRAEDYELTTEGGYAVRWNFAADNQVRFGIYSLFLDIFYQGARIATLVKDDAFSLVHRRRSGQQTDSVIDFESVVTTFGGGALYSDADVINDGYSTVYRGDRTTAAQNYDILQFHDGLWRAVPVSGLAEIIALGGSIVDIRADLTGLTSRVSDNEGNISTLRQTAAAIDLRVADAEGNIGDLQLTSTSLNARMESAEGDIGSLELTASSLSTRITNAEGDISSLEQTATGLSARISDAEGDISSLELTAQGLAARVSDAEGNISLLEQTATGLQYQVTNQSGDIATLQVSARGLSSRVSTAEGNISLIDQKADRIALAVEAVGTEVTRYEGVTDAALANMQDQIDGVIETWYYNGVPTLNNAPANTWTTDEDKANHVGDLYYDKDTGKAYRFMLDSSQNPAVFVWVELADEDIAKALALAGEKKRVFVVTPYAPYDAGDLWVRQKTVGSGTANEIWRCKTSRAAGASPGFLESEWETADNYGYVVNKSNLEVLADAIVGQVTQIVYNADGTVSTQSASTIQQTASAIRLATVVDNVALAGITIDATNQTGSVTIFSDNFFIKDGNNNKTALAITHKANGDSIIDVASLNVEGIFSTSEWSAEEYALQNYADGAASDAQSAAESYAVEYANSTAYLEGVIQSMINSSISGKADDADYSYLKTALENRTTALGGLLLTSLIQLGASVNGSSWTVRAGISGEYFPETDPTAQDYHLGHGIAAWYGGPMTDWKELTEQERLTTPYAKSLFRMDGSGYLASGEIQWGSAGDIILHGVGIEGAAVDENTTFTDGTTTFSVADLILLRSWFSIDYYLDSNQQRHYYLKLNASGSDGTAIEGFVSNGFISAGGVSPGGGASGVSLEAVWGSLTNGSPVTPTENTKIAPGHIPTATSSAVGGIMIGYSESGRNYAVQLDGNGKAYVNVPWTESESILPLADAIGDIKTSILGLGESLADLSMGIDSINALLSRPTIEALEFKLVGGDPIMTWDEVNKAWHLNGNFYADGWVSAGGVSDGSGSSGTDLETVWLSLSTNTDDYADDKIHTGHIPDVASIYGYQKASDVSAAISSAITALGLGTAATHAHSDYVTGLDWDGTNNKLAWSKGGTAQQGITIGYASSAGSATTASKLSTNGPLALWGVTYWNNGVPNAVTTAPNLYIGSTKVQTDNTNPQGLAGITTITASGQAEVGSLKLASGTPTLTWDNQNSAWHLSGNFYADGWVSAGGVSDGSGSTGVDLPAVWDSLMYNTGYGENKVIDTHHIPDMASTYGYLKTVSFSDLSSHPTTIAGYGITDAKIESGTITLGSSSITPLTSHQSIYALTMQVGGTQVGTYTPNSAASTINITKQHITDALGNEYHPYQGSTSLKMIASYFTFDKKLSDGTTESTLSWDDTNKAWKITGNLYATGWVSAGGASNGGGQTAGNASLSNVTTLAHGQTGELSASGVGNLVLYDKDAIDYMIENAGQVKKVAGISPDSLGDIPIATLKTTLGLGDAAGYGVASSVTQNDTTHLVTGAAVWAAIDALPEPMIFKGSLGTGGTITTLPTASSANDGYTYKVITAGTYAGQAAKIGDLFISNGSAWIWIPSGDEPEGTVTSVGISLPTGLTLGSGSTNPITTSGTFNIAFSTGYSIPLTADVTKGVTAYGYFDASGNAKSALKLTTVSKTAWGQTYWTSGGVPDSISGNMSSVGSISMNGSISGATTIAASTSVTAPKFYLDANTYFELDSDGYVHLVTPTGKGFYADGFVSAGGISSGGGASGIDEAAMWAALQRNSGEGENKQIHNKHLPTCGTGLSYTLNSDGIATAINVTFPVTSVAGKTGAVTLAVADITDFPTTWSWANITGAPSTMPNPAALTFGTKTYDGSVAKTITASDLGALTSVAFSDLTSHPTNLSGYGITDAQPLDADLTAIAGLTGTSGLLKKTAANTWTLDTNTYLTASTVPAATSSAYGGIKIGYTESREHYAVQLSSGKAYVNVPDSIPYSDAIGDIKTAIKGLDEQMMDLSMDIDSINALLSNPTIEALEFKLFGGAPVMTWDEANQAWHLNGNFYADGFVSAGGVSDGGGSGGTDLNAVWASLTTNTDSHGTDKIHTAHIPDMKDVYGYATQTWVGNQGYLTSSAISDMATKTWVGNQGYLTSSSISDMATKTWVGQQNYLTGNQAITLSGDVSGSGTTSISVTIGAKKVAKSMLAQGVQDSLGKADTALQSFTETDPTVPSWAKASSKPSYNLDEVSDGSTRKLSNYLPLSGGTMSNTNVVTNLNADLVDGENASAFAHRGAANNLLVAGNEFNFISAGFSGDVYLNYQDENRQSEASVSSYIFCNGRGGSFATLGASGSSFGASISVTGQISSTGDQIITSDETKKMNLEDIRLSVKDIASVRAVTYDLKADGSHSFGTIAQDWLGILPEAVLGEEGDYSFAYAQAAMVSSIINSREIIKHESEIEMLRRRVSELEAEVSRLRAN